MNEQQWGAGYSETGKSGSGRGLRKPTTATWQGGAFLLYHGQPPKPFLKPAKSKSKNAAVAAMQEAFEREVDGL
jgi:hypothetical protein